MEEVRRARALLEEGKTLVERDPVQACERLYEAAETAMRAMAKALGLKTAPGRWTATTWLEVVNQVRERLQVDLLDAWTAARVLLVEGFYERRLKPGYIKLALEDVESIVRLAELQAVRVG